jgi:shikimate kinase
MSIFFYGPPGVGKSTLGCALAETLKLPFVDLDERIASQAGMTIPEIFSSEGLSGFRARETDALVQVCAASSSVISLGGGALLSPDNRKLVESAGKVICLQASQRALAKRLALAPGERPLLGDAQKALTTLLAERFEHYRSFALQVMTSTVS